MAIKRKTPLSQIMQYMDDQISAYEAKIIEKLSYAGERCVAQAREHGSYMDRSGNLRGSIGYVIVRNGRIIEIAGFKQVMGGSEGVAEGQTFAREIASEFNKGIALIVVAGMNYAAYVEGKGYDVLTSSEMLAERIVPDLLRNLGLEKNK